jgi:hypothetical protein
VGLSEGEGQDAAQAWWVRSAGQVLGQIRIEVLDAGWDDWLLGDVDPSGAKVITTPHNTGPLLVRAFPSLEVLRAIDPPGERSGWDFTACFAGDMLISELIGDGGAWQLSPKTAPSTTWMGRMTAGSSPHSAAPG